MVKRCKIKMTYNLFTMLQHCTNHMISCNLRKINCQVHSFHVCNDNVIYFIINMYLFIKLRPKVNNINSAYRHNALEFARSHYIAFNNK